MSGDAGKTDQAQVAEYIGVLAAELCSTAQAAGLPVLAYLLAMATLAAKEEAEKLQR